MMYGTSELDSISPGHVSKTHLEYGPLPDEAFGQVFARQFSRRLELLVPVSRLTGDLLLVTQPGREGCGEGEHIV